MPLKYYAYSINCKAKHITLEKAKVMILMRSMGYDLRSIAHVLGVSEATVSRWLGHYREMYEQGKFQDWILPLFTALGFNLQNPDALDTVLTQIITKLRSAK